MRYMAILAVFAVILFGCAHAGQNPTVPVEERGLSSPHPSGAGRDAPYRLLGEWRLFINAEHDRVDVVPRRDPHFHLNALKFLEEYCKDCLRITGIKNNGDGTIDLTVQITHPFPGLPEYTGFDVKGIMMFNGSAELWTDHYGHLPIPYLCMVSWRELGDPEVLNPDGYTFRWSPVYQSGSAMPIFNYWQGKYAKGAPNAGINAYLNFYTDEERHMFRTGGQVSRTYRIWLPPGEPVIAGYAVEACWEPPTVTHVTNPFEDFPISANQPEPYHLKMVVNNGDPIVRYSPCCGEDPDGCATLRIECKGWARDDYMWRALTLRDFKEMGFLGGSFALCEPSQEGVYTFPNPYISMYLPGRHRTVLCTYEPGEHFGDDPLEVVFDLVDFTIIEE